jgi:hypothetical protein
LDGDAAADLGETTRMLLVTDVSISGLRG